MFVMANNKISHILNYKWSMAGVTYSIEIEYELDKSSYIQCHDIIKTL